MATARDVAERAGTSTAVVSYVFNNGPRNVAVGTRERVMAAAAELNYRPNALARALSFGRTASIGLIVPDISNPFFGQLARALEDAATRQGNMLLIGDAGLDPDRERNMIEAFVERRVDSAVVVSLLDEPDLSALTRARIPVIVLHPIDPNTGASSVTIDYELAAAAATRHLVGHGYESITLLNAPTDTVGASQHRAGFLAAISAAKNIVRHSEIRSDTSRQSAAEVTLNYLAAAQRPRAIYAATDEQAYGVLFAASRLGLRIPEDLAVFSCDGTAHSAYSIPPLATVQQPITGIADRAVDLLTEQRDLLPVHENAEFSLICRDSCGCSQDDV